MGTQHGHATRRTSARNRARELSSELRCRALAATRLSRPWESLGARASGDPGSRSLPTPRPTALNRRRLGTRARDRVDPSPWYAPASPTEQRRAAAFRSGGARRVGTWETAHRLRGALRRGERQAPAAWRSRRALRELGRGRAKIVHPSCWRPRAKVVGSIRAEVEACPARGGHNVCTGSRGAALPSTAAKKSNARA